MSVAGSFRDVFRSRELLWILTYRDVRGRTRQSILGYAWLVVQPLLATAVFTILIGGVLGLTPSDEAPYALFVFAGMTLWTYFAGSLSLAVESLVQHSDLLRQVSFPREVLVLYPAMSKGIDFVVSLLVLLVAAFFYGRLDWSFVLAPLLVFPMMINAYAFSLLLAPLNVALHDVGRITVILLGFAVYSVPVLYPLNQIPDEWRELYLLNPVAGPVELFRALAIGGELQSATLFLPGLAVSLALLLCGQWLFDRFEGALGDFV